MDRIKEGGLPPNEPEVEPVSLAESYDDVLERSGQKVKRFFPPPPSKDSVEVAGYTIVKVKPGDDMSRFINRPRKDSSNVDFAALSKMQDSFAELPPDAI